MDGNMRRIAICLCLLLSFCLYSCQDSAESQARKEALKVRQFQLKVLKETEANPEKSTARFRIGDKDVAVYKGMTMEEVKKHCGEPDPDANIDAGNIQVLTYKNRAIQLFFTYGILTDYAILDF